jgi:hypothetical protein
MTLRVALYAALLAVLAVRERLARATSRTWSSPRPAGRRPATTR